MSILQLNLGNMETVLKNRVISRKLGYSDSYYRGDNLPELQPFIQPLIDADNEFEIMAFCHRVHPKIWNPEFIGGGMVVNESVYFEDKICTLNFSQLEGNYKVYFLAGDIDISNYYQKYLAARGIISEVPEKVRQMLTEDVIKLDLLPEIRTKFVQGVKMEIWTSPNSVHLQVVRNGKPSENIIGGYMVRNNPDFEKVSEIKSYNEFLNLIK